MLYHQGDCGAKLLTLDGYHNTSLPVSRAGLTSGGQCLTYFRRLRPHRCRSAGGKPTRPHRCPTERLEGAGDGGQSPPQCIACIVSNATTCEAWPRSGWPTNPFSELGAVALHEGPAPLDGLALLAMHGWPTNPKAPTAEDL